MQTDTASAVTGSLGHGDKRRVGKASSQWGRSPFTPGHGCLAEVSEKHKTESLSSLRVCGARSQREANKPEIREAQDGFVGGAFHPADPEADPGHAERITRPFTTPKGLGILAVEKEASGVSLLKDLTLQAAFESVHLVQEQWLRFEIKLYSWTVGVETHKKTRIFTAEDAIKSLDFCCHAVRFCSNFHCAHRLLYFLQPPFQSAQPKHHQRVLPQFILSISSSWTTV